MDENGRAESAGANVRFLDKRNSGHWRERGTKKAVALDTRTAAEIKGYALDVPAAG